MQVHVEVALLDADGSCGDINFERSTWTGVAKLVRECGVEFARCWCLDKDGNIHGVHSDAPLKLARGEYIRYLFAGGTGLVEQLQVFVCRDDDDEPFVELTFFPQDVRRVPDLSQAFARWASRFAATLEARRYFARYENASWTFGDTGSESGVFFTSECG